MPEDSINLVTLTPREKEVIELAAEGKSNQQIAEELRITKRTVESHISNILGKTGLSRRPALTHAWLGQDLDIKFTQ